MFLCDLWNCCWVGCERTIESGHLLVRAHMSASSTVSDRYYFYWREKTRRTKNPSKLDFSVCLDRKWAIITQQTYCPELLAVSAYFSLASASLLLLFFILFCSAYSTWISHRALLERLRAGMYISLARSKSIVYISVLWSKHEFIAMNITHTHTNRNRNIKAEWKVCVECR